MQIKSKPLLMFYACEGMREKKKKENKLKYPNSSNLFLRNHVPDWHPKISTNYMLCGAT